jgi:hypothetical protein
MTSSASPIAGRAGPRSTDRPQVVKSASATRVALAADPRHGNRRAHFICQETREIGGSQRAQPPPSRPRCCPLARWLLLIGLSPSAVNCASGSSRAAQGQTRRPRRAFRALCRPHDDRTRELGFPTVGNERIWIATWRKHNDKRGPHRSSPPIYSAAEFVALSRSP